MGVSFRRYSMDLTCGNRYLCVDCTTPFVNVDSIVFLNFLRLGKRHAFGVWMIVLRKDHLKVKQILHKVEYAWNLTKYTESRLTKKLSCEIVCKDECGLFNLTVVLAKSCHTGLLHSYCFETFLK